jgi:leucine dehydrogenase
VGVQFHTGVDFGTRPADIARVITAAGGDPTFARDTNFGLLTALGVRSAMRAAARSRLGADSLAGLRIVVQGAGQVGAALVPLLVGDGAEVLVAETRTERLRPLIEALGEAVGAVPPSEALAVPCDIVAPCALGGVLSPDAVAAMRCAIVAGAANNQLSQPSVAELLHHRDILYVPDFLAGGGAALGHVLSAGGRSPVALEGGMERIGALVTEVLADAESRRESPVRSAERRARERIAAAEGDSRPARLLQ